MRLVAIAMVHTAAVLHAVWNTVAPRCDDPLAFLWSISATATVIYLLPAAYLLRDQSVRWDWLRFAIVSGFLHVLYYSLLGLAYARSDLSLAYPIARGTGLLLVPILAVPVFDSHPTPVAWLGIALVASGILWLHRPLFAAMLARGDLGGLVSIPALLTGMTIATYSINDTAGVHRANPVVYVYLVEVLSVVLMAPYLLTRRWDAVRQTARDRLPLLIGGLGSCGTYMIVLAATRLAPVAYVVPMRETSIVIGAILGARVLGESLGDSRLKACALVVAGVLAIGIGG
jgi:drug/metabolite transporter (DMT)-like permease